MSWKASLLVGSLWSVALAVAAEAATGTPWPTFPVIFAMDAESSANHGATDRIINLFLSKSVPISVGIIPCQPGSTVGHCISTGRQNYGEIVTDHPSLVDIAQHVFTHCETADPPCTEVDRYDRATLQEQIDRIETGLNEMKTWGFPDGRPFSYFGIYHENSDTMRALEQLDFHSESKHAGFCDGSDLVDPFCKSIYMCTNSTGQIMAGPNCQEQSADDLMAQVDHWRDDLHRPWAKIDFHNSDVMASGGGYNETKINQIAAIVDAFKARTDYKLITLNAYYNRTRCGGQRVTMFGTPDSDDITGSAGGDVIKTFAGNDTVSAGDGDDLICAGKGDDVVDGGGGSNTIKGGGGTDTCTNGPTVRGCEQ